MSTDRDNYQGQTIFAEGEAMSCDQRATGLNNNLLVLGPTGSGKTRYVLKPNLLEANASYVVLDTKGTLAREMGPSLEEQGFEIWTIDFAHGMTGNVGYDPLLSVRVRKEGDRVVANEQDALSIANAICPLENVRDPYWDKAAAQLLQALILLALETHEPGEASFEHVVGLYQGLYTGSGRLADTKTWRALMTHRRRDPKSAAGKVLDRMSSIEDAEKMWASIKGILDGHMFTFCLEETRRMYARSRQVDFELLGQRKVALFVTTSDVDPTMRPLTSLFMDQALGRLQWYADTRCDGGALPWPVRFFLDDFSNLYIPNMADYMAVVRSREIWVTLLCQSVTQIFAKYPGGMGDSIIANCDTLLVLGFCDRKTAEFFTEFADMPASELLVTKPDKAWLRQRGKKAKPVDRYRLEGHPRYGLVREDVRPEEDPRGWQTGFAARSESLERAQRPSAEGASECGRGDGGKGGAGLL